MSLNVLIIPEDFRKDQHILKPVIKAMLAYLGKPQANVRVCQDPLLGGISSATDWEKINSILERYFGQFKLILLLVDRDGNANRKTALNNLETQAQGDYANLNFLAENAWQEVEVWALSGCDDLPNTWNWRDIRSESNPKEKYFSEYSKICGYSQLEHEGRMEIAKKAADNYSRIRQLCPEDIQSLEARIRIIL